MGTLEELLETGLGSLVLSFGLVAGASVYWTGSIDTLPAVFERFVQAVGLTVVPPLSSAAWPNVAAAVAGVAVAVAYEGAERGASRGVRGRVRRRRGADSLRARSGVTLSRPDVTAVNPGSTNTRVRTAFVHA